MGKSLSIVAFQFLPFSRSWIVRLCFMIDRDHLDDVLSLAMQDRNPNVRYEAIQAIRENKYWKVINLVSDSIRDRDDKVRMAAVNCLGE